MEFGQMKPKAERPSQEGIPSSPKISLEQWQSTARNLIMNIDSSHQLQETEPGVKFSEDLMKLLEPQSATNLGLLFDTLRSDLDNHDFLTFGDRIILAHDTSVAELGINFSVFAKALATFPVPDNNSEILQKRDQLVQAFSDRASQLLGK